MEDYLVTVTETYTHTYHVRANSAEEAEDIVADNSDGCNVYEDYNESTYNARKANGEDLSLYETVENPDKEQESAVNNPSLK